MYVYWQMGRENLQPLDAEQVADRVREELARRRMSRQTLADKAKVSLSTLEKALAGTRPFTLATVIRIEEVFGIRLRAEDAAAHNMELAPDYLGSYSHLGVKWVEGRYLVIRPSFSVPEDVFVYEIEISWNSEAGYLIFSESQRVDANFQQSGRVSMPALSGHIYLVTNDGGQYRTMVLGRPDIEGRLFGILTSLQVGHGSQLVPVSCPVALARRDKFPDISMGQIKPDMPHHAEYRAIIDAATQRDFARFYS